MGKNGYGAYGSETVEPAWSQKKVKAGLFIWSLSRKYDDIKAAHNIIVQTSNAEEAYQATQIIARSIASAAINSLLSVGLTRFLGRVVDFRLPSNFKLGYWDATIDRLSPENAERLKLLTAASFSAFITDKVVMPLVDRMVAKTVDVLDGCLDNMFSNLEDIWGYLGENKTFLTVADTLFDGGEAFVGLLDKTGIWELLGKILEIAGTETEATDRLEKSLQEEYVHYLKGDLTLSDEDLLTIKDYLNLDNDGLHYLRRSINLDDEGLHYIRRNISIASINKLARTSARINAYPPPKVSPIVLDLDGDGIETSGALDGSVYFDFDADGRAHRSGWVGADDGFLVFDRNGDGIINDGREMFGDSTVRYKGGTCRDGFEALGQEDTSGDGILDHNDYNWHNFKVWRDLNQDGLSQADELFTLAELGISNIKLDVTATVTRAGNGNIYMGLGGFTIDGQDRILTDVWFDEDGFDSVITQPAELPEEILGLPEMGGSGALRDLREACLASPVLKNQVSCFSQLQTRAEQRAAVESLIFAWANTSGMTIMPEDRCAPSVTLDHRGVPCICPATETHVVPGGVADPAAYLDEMHKNLWCARVHVVEAFNGYYVVGMLSGGSTSGPPVGDMPDCAPPVEAPDWDTSYWRQIQGAMMRLAGVEDPNATGTLILNWGGSESGIVKEITRAYQYIWESAYYSLALQTRLAPVMEMIGFDVRPEKATVAFDFTRVEQYFSELMAEDPLRGLSDLMDFNWGTADMLTELGWKGFDLAAAALEGLEITPELAMYLRDELKIDLAGADGSGHAFSSHQTGRFIVGGDSVNTLYGGLAGDVLHGLGGNDILHGGEGDDLLYGGDGDDMLYGGDGDDLLDGGAGNDHLEGGKGNNVYVFGRGYGHDTVTIYQYDREAYNGVRLVGLTFDEVEFGTVTRPMSGTSSNFIHDLVIKIKDTGETITVVMGLNGNQASLDFVEFADGLILGLDDIKELGFHGTDGDETIRLYAYEPGILYGGTGNDILYGGRHDDKLYGEAGDGDDVLDGGAGNDYLVGGLGDDTYIFRVGYGQDTINNGSGGSWEDTLKLVDLNPEDLWFERSGNHLLIGLIGTNDQVTISYWYNGGSYQINKIEAEGMTLVNNQVAQLVQAMSAIGTPGAADGGWTNEQREALSPIIASYWQPRV